MCDRLSNLDTHTLNRRISDAIAIKSDAMFKHVEGSERPETLACNGTTSGLEDLRMSGSVGSTRHASSESNVESRDPPDRSSVIPGRRQHSSTSLSGGIVLISIGEIL